MKAPSLSVRFREEVNKRERERESFPAETGLVKRLSVEWTRMAGSELSRGNCRPCAKAQRQDRVLNLEAKKRCSIPKA